MYTQAELNALTTPLSNEARVLYCLGLRTSVNATTATTEPISYKPLLALLNGDKPQGDQSPFNLGRHVNLLLKQLENAGLVALPQGLTFDQSLNGQVVILPLSQSGQDQFAQLHQQHTAMTTQWQPEAALVSEMASLLGLIDQSYEDEDVGEFKAYWLGRPQTVLSLFQWSQKFTYALKRKRTVMGFQAVKKVGSQQVPVAPSVEADDNARKLVEKYSSQHKKS